MLDKLGEIKNYYRNYVELLINENINVFDNFHINDTDIINNLFKIYLLKQRVSYTRAKDQLYLLDNNGYDHTINNNLTISRFIVESNCSSLTIKGIKNEDLNKNDLSSNDSNLNHNSKYKIGDTIYHTIFGKGIILHINNDSLDILFENDLLRSISKDSPTLLMKNNKAE